MELSELEMGSKLELELFDNNGVRTGKTLISEYEWLEDGNRIAIAAPISERRIVPVPAGSSMNIYFIKQDGSIASLFKFRAIVKARYDADKLKILLVEKQGEIVGVQRRNHFRLDTLLEVGYRTVGTVKGGYPGVKQFKKALSVNLSGGGICLLLDDELDKGDLIECNMTFDRERNIRFFGKIVRFDEADREGRYRYKAGVAYIEIAENDREAVVRYIFQEQRKLLRKGLV
ncbi:MAG TPA: PilZ domain-containing protein [Clostridia bacterium]|nr:PilZ domain-containing protein [Clostridia bacterium]